MSIPCGACLGVQLQLEVVSAMSLMMLKVTHSLQSMSIVQLQFDVITGDIVFQSIQQPLQAICQHSIGVAAIMTVVKHD